MDLGAKSIWSDEAVSIFLAKQSWANFWHIVTTFEANMALYYLLLRGWVVISGGREFWVRLLSVLMSVAVIPVVYWLGKEVFSRQAGIFAALLLALNPFDIRYAQEARGYSLFVLLVSVSFLALIQSFKNPGRFWGICYVLSTTFALYAHFFAALAVLVQVMALVVVPGDRSRLVKRQGLWVSIVIVLGLPLLWFVLFRNQGQLGWVPPVHGKDVYGIFRFLLGSGLKFGIAAIGFLLATNAWIARCRKGHWTMETWSVLVLLLWLFLPILLTLLVSIWKPIYAPRFLIFCLPAALLLVGGGLAEIRLAGLRYALVLAMVVSAVGPLRAYYAEVGQEDWRSAVQFLATNVGAGDAEILPNRYCELPLKYALEQAGVNRPAVKIILPPYSEQLRVNPPEHLWMVTCFDH